MMSDDKLHYELRGQVAVLRMDDGKVNALSTSMIEALDAALERADKEARAVALFGRTGNFSAGFDLKIMMSGTEPMVNLVSLGCETLMKLYEFPKPVVAGVTGHALAAGVLLAAACDVRIGASGAFKLGLNELRQSMPVPVFAHELARARLDPRELTAATLCAKIYDPESAKAAGWLDDVAAADELEARVMATAEALAKLSGRSFALTKRSLRKQTLAYVRDSLEDNLATLTFGG